MFKLKPATYEVAAHIFGEWSVETQARTAETVKVRSCQVCGYEERVSVPAEPDVKKDISVNYTFVSGTEKVELPAEVLALLPKDTNSYAAGDKVTAMQPDKTSVKVSGAAKATVTGTVKTGDVSQLGVWAVLTVIAGAFVTIFGRLRRKNCSR